MRSDFIESTERNKNNRRSFRDTRTWGRRNDRNDKQRRRPKSQSAPTSRGQSDFGDGDFDRRISFSRDKSRNRDREQRDYRDRGDHHRDREHGDRNNQVKKQSGNLNRTGSNRNNPNNQRRKNNRGKSRGRHPDDNADGNFRREVIVANHKDDRIETSPRSSNSGGRRQVTSARERPMYQPPHRRSDLKD